MAALKFQAKFLTTFFEFQMCGSSWIEIASVHVAVAVHRQFMCQLLYIVRSCQQVHPLEPLQCVAAVCGW